METERLSNDLDGQNFENQKYDPSKSTVEILLDNSCDADLNFYNINIRNINIPYIIPENVHTFLNDSPGESFSVLHLNIRSTSKYFENFKKLFSSLRLG